MRIITRMSRRQRAEERTRALMSAMSNRRGQVERLGRIRQFVFGIQDGLLTTLGVVTGVSGATAHQNTILIAGCAEAIAGVVAMASGEFISSRSQAQVYQAEIETERTEVEKDPIGELEEIKVLFQQEGLSPENASAVAQLISTSQKSWLKTMTEKELGLAASDASGAIVGAAIMGVAFLLGAAVPIFPYIFFAVRPALALSIVLTLLVLSGMGVGKARLARLNPVRSALEVVAIGSLAATIGYLFGTLLPHIFHAA